LNYGLFISGEASFENEVEQVERLLSVLLEDRLAIFNGLWYCSKCLKSSLNNLDQAAKNYR